MNEKLRVGILGATGMVGQHFVSLLTNHPWFTIAVLAASDQSAGKTYEEALHGRWNMQTPIPDSVRNRRVYAVNETETIAKQVDFLFSAVNMPNEEIKAMEEEYARLEIPVISSNSAHRWTPDVPMILPEINPDHTALIPAQRKRLGTKRGFITVKSNCSIQSYTPVLTAWKEFEPYEASVITMQAISGAGKTFDTWPKMTGNVLPYIPGEEEKSEQEPLRIWGSVDQDRITPAIEPLIASQCIRVPVLYGHMAAVSLNFRQNPTKEQLIRKLWEFRGEPQIRDLPSAPKQFLQYLSGEDRPQITLDVDYENGMGISVGRLRPDRLFQWKFVGLSHNTRRGAAGGSILCAELLVAQGWIRQQ